MCRYADAAPGPPLKTNVTGRPRRRPPATYATEKISAAGFSFLRRTVHLPVAVYWSALRPFPTSPWSRRPRAARGPASSRSRRSFVLVAHGRSGYPLPSRRERVRVSGIDAHPDRPPYPVRLEGALDPGVSRWLWLVKWALAIPHYIVLAFLWLTLLVLTVIAFFAILFTGRYPRGIFDFNLGVLRWTWRVAFYSYAALGTDRYPPFTLDDVPDYPARLDVAYPERLSRGLVLVKWWLLAIPQYLIVGILLGGGSYAACARATTTGSGASGTRPGLIGVLVFFAGVALLFTARYPRGLFDFVLGLDRWVARVAAYVLLMRDEYPPFRLDQGGAEAAAAVADEPAVGAPSARGGVADDLVSEAGRRRRNRGQGRPDRRRRRSPESSRSASSPSGCALVAVDRTQRDDDGYLMSPSREFSTSTYAIVSESAELDTDGAEWALDTSSAPFASAARARGRSSSASGPRPPSTATCGTSSTTSIDDFDRGDPHYSRRPGRRHATPPAPRRSGPHPHVEPGEQTLDWEPKDGTWRVVVMNADASRGVSVRHEHRRGARLRALDRARPARRRRSLRRRHRARDHGRRAPAVARRDR